jgi:hypothetical protein
MASVSEAFSATTNFLTMAIQEWFNSLVDQPIDPPFVFNATFNNEIQRVSRLVAAVIILSTIVIGSGKLFVAEFSSLDTFKVCLSVLIGSFLIAILYKPFAYVFRVRVSDGEAPARPLTLRQMLFTILYTIVPWIPVYCFLWMLIIPAEGTMLILVILGLWACTFYMLFNLVKALMMVTHCRWYLVTSSLIFPLFLLCTFVLFY